MYDIHILNRVIPAVPAPSVMLRVGGRVDGSVVVGDSVVMICDMELSAVVRGRDVAVDVTWFQDNDELTSSTRIIVSSPIVVMTLQFRVL